MNKKTLYRLLPLITFACLTLLLLRGLFLEPRIIPSVKLNKPSPQFKLVNLMDGQVLTQTILTGRWTVLNVWASWCEACAIEHPFLVNLHKQGIKIVGLNYKDEYDSAKSWLENYGNPYQAVLFDQDGNVAIDFGVYGSPETYLIDSQGVIRYRHIGILSPDIWQHEFLPLINEKPA